MACEKNAASLFVTSGSLMCKKTWYKHLCENLTESVVVTNAT